MMDLNLIMKINFFKYFYLNNIIYKNVLKIKKNLFLNIII